MGGPTVRAALPGGRAGLQEVEDLQEERRAEGDEPVESSEGLSDINRFTHGSRRAYLILFWVGFFALFKGIEQIMLSFGVRHAGKEIDAASAMA